MTKKLDDMTEDEIKAQLHDNAAPIVKSIFELVMGKPAGQSHIVDDALVMHWELQRRKEKDLPIGGRVEKPWGYMDELYRSPTSVLKRITVKSGASLSLQAHQKRSEFWVIESGTATIQIGGQLHIQKAGFTLEVPRHTIHRISNGGPEDLVILELQFGECAEEDITRLEDNYGRK